jgi:hypothetical protein
MSTRTQPAPYIASPDMTISEVMPYRRESETSVFRKMAAGVYRSHRNGRRRLIERASVEEDRERSLAGPQFSAPPPTGKRPPGRPRKQRTS